MSIKSTAPAAVALACLISCCGCGPLGLYSLGHNLYHHHLFKPILPDELGESPATDEAAAQPRLAHGALAIGSGGLSSSDKLPIEEGRCQD